jgi:hypothetical protein
MKLFGGLLTKQLAFGRAPDSGSGMQAPELELFSCRPATEREQIENRGA